MKFGTIGGLPVHGPQRMNPNNPGDSLLIPPKIGHLSSDGFFLSVLDGLARNFVQTFVDPRLFILVTLVIIRLFLWHCHVVC